METNRESFKPDPLVSTRYGMLEGVRDSESGTLRWLGVPYAKPPANELRWKAPLEPEAWEGVRSAKQYGNSAVQLMGEDAAGAEDCLYLNVRRPDDESAGLPVFVFAHGGGNLGGAGRDFRGERLAKATRSIVISINYRLGAMGFFRHPLLRTGDPLDDSGNYGLLDIVQSLRWVRGNIERFGGDPDRVTLGGQSAGARNVLAALISPCARGLFRQAVVMSGGMTTADPRQGDAKGEEVAAKALAASGFAATEDEAKRKLMSLPAEEAAALLRSLGADRYARALGQAAIQMAPFPHLFEDGAVIPEGGFGAADRGQAPRPPVPVVLGSLETEFSVFAMGDPEFAPFAADGSLTEDPEKSKLYEAAVRYGSELYAGFNAERVAEWLTERQDPPPPVYTYRFCWGNREGVIDDRLRFLLGASHGADVMFYTGDFAAALQNHPDGYVTADNEPGREALTAILHGYVRNFLHAGNPNGDGLPLWSEWSPAEDRPRILRLDADAERAIVRMSGEYLRDDGTLASMEADPDLTPERRAWIQSRIFDGRFFRTGGRRKNE
ncbi:carboxylesterase family protein [Cohnella zeiphila]|uniref:Carboxylic ester hydrolase n=1 Tax=Cohnella zeiphila TaxID=2761120 RepID=A0A7X0VTD9_9BACL|nr:carboxylesterase family protein [Cohnella zeiphila]MBB6729831.1 carboxylesterase/lipase family protein [Cohnella zeiphila]